MLKWALALAAGEIFHHLFYLNCIAIDIQMIKKMQYFNLVAFVVCTIYKTMIELYICYAFNYAVCAIDGIIFEVMVDLRLNSNEIGTNFLDWI